MKINTLSLIAGAAVLLGSMVSCEKTGEIKNPNPTYDPNTNTVTTEFVLNVSTNTGKDTKTTAEFAQVNSPFLGMEAVHLLAYKLPYTNTAHGPFYYNPYDSEGAIKATRDYDLATLFTPGAVTTEKASRTVEIALPLGTNSVVLYGKALKNYSDDLQGNIDITGSADDLTTLAFTLKPRLSSMNAFDAGAFLFSRMFTYFCGAGLVNENTFWTFPGGSEDKSYAFWFPIPSEAVAASLPANPVDGTVATGSDSVTYTYYNGEVSWKQLGMMYDYEYDTSAATISSDVVSTKNGTKMTLSPLTEVMGDAYSVLTTIKEAGELKELRGGCATSVLRMVEDLYAIIERAANATPNLWEEQAAKLLAIEVKGRIDKFFSIYSGELDFLRKSDNITPDVATILESLETSCSAKEWAEYETRLRQNLNEAYFPTAASEGFPVNIGLPFGAAVITCTKNYNVKTMDQFQYTTDIPAYGFGDVTMPITNYRYPAELCYFGNSAIRVTDQSKPNYPSSISAWNSEGLWTGWESKAAVQSSTRSVAMINNINYGTALLASTVKFATGVTVLKDNNAALHPGESDQSIDVSGGGFTITGIVVSGQPDVVGWDFTRRPDNGDYSTAAYSGGKFNGMTFDNNPFTRLVYDKVLNPVQVGSSSTIYTMLWDNYDATKTADEQADVYVGLELVNNTDQDFWGEMNLIRKGGTFYILGKMDLATALALAGTKFDNLDRSYYCYPPFDPSNGNTINVPRVFMQDYMTTANLIIGENALKHAYVTVPDLRSSQVSLGMSVDMSWTPGLAFDVNMGGN